LGTLKKDCGGGDVERVVNGDSGDGTCFGAAGRANLCPLLGVIGSGDGRSGVQPGGSGADMTCSNVVEILENVVKVVVGVVGGWLLVGGLLVVVGKKVIDECNIDAVSSSGNSTREEEKKSGQCPVCQCPVLRLVLGLRVSAIR
jgi:hypothetical protein